MHGRTPVFPIGPARPEWQSIFEQAQRQRSGRGLPRPAGLPQDGVYSLTQTYSRSDGTCRYYLYYIYDNRRSRCCIGVYEGPIELSESGRTRRPETRENPGIPVGKIIDCENGLRIRITIETIIRNGHTHIVPRPIPIT